MGGGDETSTQSTAPSNPDVQPTLSRLLQGVQGTYNTTQQNGTPAALAQGWASQFGAASNPDFMRGVSGATADFADAAAGNQYGANDAYYDQLSDNTMRDVGAMFTNSGRFGSGSHVETAVKALGDVNNANIAADRAWQAQAASALPAMFSAGQMPGAVQTAIGQDQRAAPWYNLGQASSILAGTAGAGGSTSTMTQPAAPWWQAPVAIGGTLASAFF